MKTMELQFNLTDELKQFVAERRVAIESGRYNLTKREQMVLMDIESL